ncbi:MAG: hypothetical protein EP338_08980 [Bacteroidetes bacterium]|nr:MAG: hypothetical protein EP338_08980 [Bacteroidota bacterium]
MYKEQDKYLDFILRIEDVQRTIEQKYQNYLSMSFQNDIELVVDQKDTLKCVGFSFDQVAEISPNRTFKIGFERPKKYKELELILSQPEKEEIKFRYVYADLANTPKIRWK